jgi:hypothetical protein
LDKQLLEEFEPYLAELQTMVSAVKTPPASSAAALDLASQLARLAQLPSEGVLSDEEFTAAKVRSLGG